jgi:hypothetical protein
LNKRKSRRREGKMSIADRKEVKEVFKYSILEAIARRRSRRFPMGCTLNFGALKYDSKRPPVPLSDLELAILCWSGAGITGSITSETIAEEGNEIISWVGRAIPNPCNVHTTKLFFTNDNGSFLYNPKTATKRVEIETEADWDRIMTYFKEDCIKIMDERVQMFPELLPPTIGWNTNQPGTTVFIPVVDHSEEYLNTLFIVLAGAGYQLFDDIKGRPAGLQKYVDAGDLKGPPVGLSSWESAMSRGVFMAPAYLILEHMHLVAEAMGLGSVMFAGYTGEVMLGITPMSKGLGFRSVTDKMGKVNAVGLDNVFEAYCPPYYKSMDDAVDAFVEKKYGAGSPLSPDYKGVLPFADKVWQKVRPKYSRPSKTTIDIVKAFCNYVYGTYGKIPATVNTKVIPVWLQVHHIDVGFYDKFFAREIITEAQRNHMELWHK